MFSHLAPRRSARGTPVFTTTAPLHRIALAACLLASAAATPSRAQSSAAQSPAAITTADLDRLVGPSWAGTLEYRDYSSDKQTTIRSTLRVRRLPSSGTAASAWEMRVGYNDEPNANSLDTLTLSSDGRSMRGETVVERSLSPDGSLRIITEQDGTDNNRPARFRFVYSLSDSAVTLQKLVRVASSDEFFERNIYRWTLPSAAPPNAHHPTTPVLLRGRS